MQNNHQHIVLLFHIRLSFSPCFGIILMLDLVGPQQLASIKNTTHVCRYRIREVKVGCIAHLEDRKVYKGGTTNSSLYPYLQQIYICFFLYHLMVLICISNIANRVPKSSTVKINRMLRREDDSIGERRKRVWKACVRCRIKKTKVYIFANAQFILDLRGMLTDFPV
jgi:hypothetical protein